MRIQHWHHLVDQTLEEKFKHLAELASLGKCQQVLDDAMLLNLGLYHPVKVMSNDELCLHFLMLAAQAAAGEFWIANDGSVWLIDLMEADYVRNCLVMITRRLLAGKFATVNRAGRLTFR